MGCSRSYWLKNIENIYKATGTNSFTWSQIMSQYPDMTKSILSRLKCSGWICKDKKPHMVNGKPTISKTVLWKLHPEAITMCRNGNYTKSTPTKKCKCDVKTIKK